MASRQTNLPEIGDIVLTKRRSSKNIRISFNNDGLIRVSLPLYVPYSAGINFVKKNQSWLEKHRPEESIPIEEGDRIGKAHQVIFKKNIETLKPNVRVTSTKIIINLPNDTKVEEGEAQKAAIRGAHRALIKEGRQLLPIRIKNLSEKFGFSYNSVDVKKLTSRWGSCSQQKDIVLNIFLMQLPWDLIDYVLIHELVHTEHMNHSDKFWQRFESVLPEAKKIRKVLKKHKTIVIPIKQN